MIDIHTLEKERLEWSIKTFPSATAKSSLIKLSGEVEEVRQELDRPIVHLSSLVEEYADCLMCLFDSAGRAGISTESITKAFERKLAINKACEWKDNGNGTYSRIKATVV